MKALITIAGAGLLLASQAVFAAGNIEAGKAAAEKFNCASCHGKDFQSPIDPAYP